MRPLAACMKERESGRPGGNRTRMPGLEDPRWLICGHPWMSTGPVFASDSGPMQYVTVHCCARCWLSHWLSRISWPASDFRAHRSPSVCVCSRSLVQIRSTAALPQFPGVEASERCQSASSKRRRAAESRPGPPIGIAPAAAVETEGLGCPRRRAAQPWEFLRAECLSCRRRSRWPAPVHCALYRHATPDRCHSDTTGGCYRWWMPPG